MLTRVTWVGPHLEAQSNIHSYGWNFYPKGVLKLLYGLEAHTHVLYGSMA